MNETLEHKRLNQNFRNTGVARAASQLNRFKPKDIPTPKVTIQEVSTRALVLDSVTRYKYTEGRFSLNEL